MNYYIGLYSPNKAKRDIDTIMQGMGFTAIAIPMNETNSLTRFIKKLLCVLKTLFVLHKGDLLLIQYPFKKYYHTLCLFAHIRGAKTVTLIHDLGTFRRRKLTAQQEIRRLKDTDCIIAHNEKMEAWLKEHGSKIPTCSLHIFDYLSSAEPSISDESKTDFRNIVYAGGIHRRKNAFIYQADQVIAPCHLHLYGPGEVSEEEQKEWKNITYHGLMDSDAFIASVQADWGLVWDGDTTDGCSGIWGSYLRLNNPHKTSFYLRAGIPVIVWEESAMAPFITSHRLGIAVSSLQKLPERLNTITPQEYATFKQAVLAIKKQLNEGHFFKDALRRATTHLEAH